MASVLGTAQKSGQTWSIVLDTDGSGQALYVYNSTSGASNGYIGKISANGTYTGGTTGGSATLAGDSDVSIASPSNGQVLTYSSASSSWKNQTLPSPLGVANTWTAIQTFADPVAFTYTALPTATTVGIGADNGATAGLYFNVPTSSTNGFTFNVNGSQVGKLSAAGALTVASVTSTGTSNSLGSWPFNPVSNTDFYLGSPGTTAGKLHIRTNGYSNGTDVVTIDSTGAIAANGLISTSRAYGNWMIQWSNGATGGTGAIGSSSSTTVSGIIGSQWEIGSPGGGTTTLTQDTSGNMGIAGNIALPTTGNLLLGNATGNLQLGTTGTTLAGITGALVGFATQNTSWLMTFDKSGNMGIAGSYYAASSATLKRDVRELVHDPLEIVRHTKIVHFNYAHDPDDAPARMGFIAEDTHELLAGPEKNRFDFMAVGSITLAAVQQLLARVESLEAQVAAQ